MKTIIFLSMLLLMQQESFCDGFYDGYREGICFERVGCVPPAYVPHCPNPQVGFDTYQDGYNKGFIEGYADQE